MDLDVITTDRFVTSREGVTYIDLSAVDFLLPGGIVAVACRARHAFERGEQLHLIGPTTDNVARYASRMGLGEVLTECSAQNPLPPVGRRELGDVLVECHWADDASIDELSILVSDRLWEAGVPAEVTDLVSSAVYEIADNVKTHAASGGGFICAQTYQRGTRHERVEVAVGDIGCGVRASLQPQHTPSDDEAALRLAITESVTGLADERRGLGLHYVARDVPRAGGRLTIRSGSAYLHVHPGGPFSASSATVPGTLVEIRVPVDGLRRGY